MAAAGSINSTIAVQDAPMPGCAAMQTPLLSSGQQDPDVEIIHGVRERLAKYGLNLGHTYQVIVKDVTDKLVVFTLPVAPTPTGLPLRVTIDPRDYEPSPLGEKILRYLQSGPKNAAQVREYTNGRMYERGGVKDLKAAGLVEQASGRYRLTEAGEDAAAMVVGNE